MSIDLMSLKVEKRPDRLRFDGRILYLVDDADVMRRQLDGEDLELTGDLRARLRDQISTDEITPAYICYYFDETSATSPTSGCGRAASSPSPAGWCGRAASSAPSAGSAAARGAPGSSRRTRSSWPASAS
jgi:3-isopropylmalate/(R)-2-methylmalate dehydratase large subunit